MPTVCENVSAYLKQFLTQSYYFIHFIDFIKQLFELHQTDFKDTTSKIWICNENIVVFDIYIYNIQTKQQDCYTLDFIIENEYISGYFFMRQGENQIKELSPYVLQNSKYELFKVSMNDESAKEIIEHHFVKIKTIILNYLNQ